MRISAKQIDRWADTPAAKGDLPVLVRRLICATATLTELVVRGADTSNFPGWDGEIHASTGGTWVPAGQSRWEMGCNEEAGDKANSDYKTRTEATSPEEAKELDYLFVTPRIWAGKKAWQEKAQKKGHWRSVRAYDADDLEVWLEDASGVRLWLADLLGLHGPGVTSVEAFWETWRTQTQISLTAASIMAGRSAQAEQLAKALAGAPPILTLEADSCEEAVAFACAQIDALGRADEAVCVTEVDGWRFVDANPALRILLATNPSVAAARAPRAGTTLIVAISAGDRALSGSAIEADLVLERPDGQSFERALIDLGEERADAARLTSTCGRSWSVYRRRRARNPAISRPAWMADPSASCLTAIVLVGAWNGGRGGDVACVEAVTGRKYEEVERDLLKLATMDDAPVLKIGSIWKAKAPLELLYLYGPALTGDQLARFFSTATAVLTKPDPALELEPDKRWMANVYGRVRDESGIVISSVVDSLAKLNLYAENTGNDTIMAGVHRLVTDLFEDADAQRWLSLSDFVRELAEACPELFLRTVHASLQRADAPIGALFTENTDDLMFGKSWHTHLLWALEILAWSPKHLALVCDALARLVAYPVLKNLMNRPINSLISVLRPEWPQTTATVTQRIAVIDRLIRDHIDVAWEVLTHYIATGPSFGSANAKPRWRDYDSGAPEPNQADGSELYFGELGVRILALAAGHSDRIATLVQGIDGFEGDYRDQLLGLLRGSTAFPDAGRQIVRDALRKHLSWHFSHNRKDATAIAEATSLRPLFDELAPDDLAMRHAWVFESGWVELPDGREQNYQESNALRERLQVSTVEEIFQAAGWTGVERLIELAKDPFLVGWRVGASPSTQPQLADWVLGRLASQGGLRHSPVLRGVLHGMPRVARLALLEQLRASPEAEVLLAVLADSPFSRETWDFVDALPDEVGAEYWRRVQPDFLRDDGPDLQYVVDKLLAVDRHRTAFNVLQYQPASIGTPRLLALLEGILRDANPDGVQLDGYRICEALAALAKDESVPRRQLAVLEFHYSDAFERRKGSATLRAEMISDPEFFMELICLAFRSKDPDEASAEGSSPLGAKAWQILHNGRGVPGMDSSGKIEHKQFFDWIERVRSMAREKHRADATDSTIGSWLSHCPEDADGLWPCAAVRELLEDPSAEIIRGGFQSGVYNNRGVHSRAMLAGGGPERSLVERYRAAADAVRDGYPQTAATLDALARGYERDARDHDDDAALMREGP